MRLTEISVRALKGSDTYATYYDDIDPWKVPRTASQSMWKPASRNATGPRRRARAPSEAN